MRNKEKYNAYQKEYQLKRYHDRRRFAIEYLGGRCSSCLSELKLEIDHIEPKKKAFSIGKMWSVAESTFIAELNKCQLLCSDCHLLKTKAQHNKTVRHGEGLTGKRNCRCDLCKPLKNAYRQRFR